MHIGLSQVDDVAEEQRPPQQQQDERPDRSAEPREQPLDHERPADEPVRRPHELHDLDLAAPREDREPDRVRDQQRRRHEQDDERDQHDDPQVARDG